MARGAVVQLAGVSLGLLLHGSRGWVRLRAFYAGGLTGAGNRLAAHSPRLLRNLLAVRAVAARHDLHQAAHALRQIAQRDEG